MSGGEDGGSKKNGDILEKKQVSPYFLSSNDKPGNLITHVQLKGENYEEWSRAIRMALRAKKKLVFVDGTMKKPDDESPNLEDWWTVNSMLVAWVFNTIEPSLRSTITHVECVKDLWDDIKQRFSIGNGPRVQQLRSDLADCKQKGQSIEAYYGRLKMIWDELMNYDQIPICQCSGCHCNLTTQFEKKREDERVHQFFIGLDDTTYGPMRSNVLSSEPLPNLNRVYAMTIQEERLKTVTKAKDEREPMSFAVQAKTRGTGYEVRDKTISCTICYRSGHEAESCFEVIGYPEWWGDRAKSKGRRSGRGWGTTVGPSNGSGRGRGAFPRANATQAT